MLGYTSWHQLFVYSCISYLLSADLFMLLLLNYLLFLALDLLLSFVHTVYMHEYSSFSYTLIRPLLTTLICTSRSFGHLLILFRCSCDHTLREELELLSFWFWYLTSFYSYFCTFLDSWISDSVSTQFFLYDIMRGCLYVIL